MDLQNFSTVGGRVKGKTKNDLVYATWSFTSTCNYTCDYCPVSPNTKMQYGSWKHYPNNYPIQHI